MENAVDLVDGVLIDELGVKRDLSESEIQLVADRIGMVHAVIDLAAGDLINMECKRLGLPELTSWSVKESNEKFSLLSPLLKSMGYAISTASAHAEVARSWPRGDRVGGLTYGHYKALQGCNGEGGKLTRAAARAILQDAQMGYQKPDGSWVKPHPPSWVKREREAKEGRAKARVKQVAHKATHENLSSIVPDVEKAIKATGVPEKKVATLTRKVESAIKKTTKKLQDEFVDAVDREAKIQREKLKQEQSQWAHEKKRYTQLRSNIGVPITMEEFRILRQFCHPDKHPGNEDKAQQAYNIVTEIGKRLQYDKKNR